MKTLMNDLRAHLHVLYLSLAATFGWGMAAHGYMFANNSISHDSLREFHAEILGNNIKMGSGRIFTPIYRELLGSDVTLPWLMGILALVWIGIAVFLTLRIFRINSRMSAFLIAGIYATNIAVSATAATYIHDLDSYMFSLMCAVIAVYLWKQLRFGWLPGAVFIAGSLGIYQGYLFAAVVLVMIDCIFRLFDKAEFSVVFSDGMKAIGMFLLGGALYYVSMKLILTWAGVQLVKGDYNSMDLILHQSPQSMVLLLKGAYADCFHHIWEAYSSYPSVLVKAITCAFFLICGVCILTALHRGAAGIMERILVLVLIALLPLGMNMIYVLVISRTHDLMTFPICLFYLFVLLAAEWLKQNWNNKENFPAKAGKYTRAVCILAVVMLLYGNVRFSNGMYMKKDLEYDAYLSLMTRVASRMEAEENYVPGETPVVFVGLPDQINDVIPGFKEYWNVIGMTESDLIIAPERSRYRAYFDYVMGLPVNLADYATWNAIYDSEFADAMPCYPASGSIAFHEDILVVKLGDIPEIESFDYYQLSS